MAERSDRRGRRGDGERRERRGDGPRRPYKRRELPPGYEVEKVPMPEEVPRPDNDAQRAKLSAFDAVIEGHKKERQRLSDLIGDRGRRSSGVTGESKEARDRLNEIRGELNRLKEERSALTARVKAAADAGKAKFEEAKALRGELRFTSLQKIEDRIDDLQHKQETESMPLPAEKALMKEISDLRAQRGMVAVYDKLMQESNTARDESRAARAEVNERLTELNAEMDAVRARMDAQWQIVKEFDAKRDAQRGDIPALIEQRKAANAKVEEAMAERRAVRDANQAEWAAYKEYMGELYKAREAQKALDKVGWDKYYADQRAERAAEEAKAAEALEEAKKAHHPWEPELETLQVLINYLRPMVALDAIVFDPILPPGATPAPGSDAKTGKQVSLSSFLKSQSAETVTANATDGAAAAPAAPTQDFGKVRAYGKKSAGGAAKTEGAEFGSFMSMLGSGLKKGGKRGKKGGRKGAVAASGAPELVDAPVRLDMKMIGQLTAHKIPVPHSTSQIPPVLKALADRHAQLMANPPKPTKGKKAPKAAAAPPAEAAPAPAEPAAVAAPPGLEAADTGVSVGDAVKTPYGTGQVTEVRASGMVVVGMDAYQATAFLNPADVTLA